MNYNSINFSPCFVESYNISPAAPIITASAGGKGEEQRCNIQQIFSKGGLFFFDAVNDAHPDTEQR